MGSRIMHMIIGNKIAEHLLLDDKTLFILGAIAPDAVPSKEISHFFSGNHSDFSRRIDYNGFLHKYGWQSESHYIIGYFTHLIADDLWLTGFYSPWLKNRLAANPELLTLYHNDFRLLNGKLLEYYHLKEEMKLLLQQIPTLPDLDEVTSKDVGSFIPHILTDLEYEDAISHEQLNVLSFNQIIGYIETSVEKALQLIDSNPLNREVTDSHSVITD